MDNNRVDGSFYEREVIDVDCLMQAITGYCGCEGLNKILKKHDDLLNFIDEKNTATPDSKEFIKETEYSGKIEVGMEFFWNPSDRICESIIVTKIEKREGDEDIIYAKIIGSNNECWNEESRFREAVRLKD